uniref:Uncharacterized protein n=1 Tax=Panagrolaimus davidi TaxID=227884 RepID=A0A914PRF0_9BILA
MESRKRLCDGDKNIDTNKKIRLEESDETSQALNLRNQEIVLRELSDSNDNTVAAARAAFERFLGQTPGFVSLPPVLQQQVVHDTLILRNNDNLPPPQIVHQTLWDFIPADLFIKLEAHQKEGIKFLFKRVIGDVDKFDESGNGAILAHNMGLGKTVTIIVFLHAVLSLFQDKKCIPSVLLVVPKNVIEQWKDEITKWINENENVIAKINVLWIKFKKNKITADEIKTNCLKIEKWSKTKDMKQIFLITYEQLKKYLDLGCIFSPDIVVFDEAHRLKNDETKTYKIAERIKTHRKVFVTGTPHQNNLIEFYNLVNLIAPSVLSTKELFDTHFVQPIQAGQSKDAQPAVIKTMRIRCYVLYNMLINVIHRKSKKTITVKCEDGSVKVLNKHEITIKVRLSQYQNQLLNKYLARTDRDTGSRIRDCFMTDITAMRRILTHPTLIHRFAEESEKRYEQRVQEKLRKNPNAEPIVKIFSKDWMDDDADFKVNDEFNYLLSNKISILLEIIKQCEEAGDKFLNLIEEILSKNEENWFNSHKAKANEDQQIWGWTKDVDYFRNDGEVSADDRHKNQNKFNEHQNKRCRLMLVSTTAGALGTNLIGANRVVLFDGCWNPTLDKQSLYRAYRMKQTKDVYVYRLVTHGTLEDAIYKRQINKESIAHRILDKEDLYNQFTTNELQIYVNDYIPETTEPNLQQPFEDKIIETLIKNIPQMIVSIQSHDSFFDPCENDEITDEDLLLQRLGFERFYRHKCSIANN